MPNVAIRLLAAALLFNGSQVTASQVHPAQHDYAAVVEKLDAAIQFEVVRKQLPAFSIVLVDGDKTIWSAGFGYQDKEQRIPATADTVYRVGSVSKIFTDMAVMQLVEEHRVDLDSPVHTMLPGFHPQNSFDQPVTLRQLMSHQAGLVRESPVGHYFDPSEPSLTATVASLNQTRLIYAPGTRTKYSNAAVSVVGAVLESQLAVSHAEQIRQRILQPLGMSRSSFNVAETIQPHLATGWMWTYDGRRFVAPTFQLGTGPAGNMYASMNDLGKFLSWLLQHGAASAGTEHRLILQPDSLHTMLTPVTDNQGRAQDFGLGFHIHQLDGHRKVGHGGAIYGFSTQLEALPERRLGVAASASLDGSNGVVSRLCDYALRLMLAVQDGQSLPAYVLTEAVPPDRARELAGSWQTPEGPGWVQISELGGDLFMQRGTFRYNLRARSSDGSIVADDVLGGGTEVALISSDRLRIANAEYVRAADQPPADVPEHWKGLIGEYGWDHNTLYILEEHGQLYALIEWFYYYPLTEQDPDTFLFPDYGLYQGEGLRFQRDASGRAVRVNAAEVDFVRRATGPADGETFRITPLRAVPDLRSAAMAASPPTETGDFREPDLVELTGIDSSIRLDIRYASTNNFMGSVFYQQPRAFLQRPAAEALVRANAVLHHRDLCLLVHDAYRPWHVTKMFWDATPESLRDFVANPANGSRHNRGCAVDLTLFDLQASRPIEMVSGYDEFSPRSFPLYPGGTSRQRWYRDLLRRVLQNHGYTVYDFEWWHFDFQDWKRYRIGNATFEQLLDEPR